MYRGGYTKHWRKRWDNDYCKDHLLWVLMDYFIDHANYKDSEIYFPNVGAIPLKRGQHIFGTRKLAEKLGVDRQRVRTKLKILKKIEFLTLKPTHNYTIATVINYDTYQSTEYETNPPTNPKLTHSKPTPNPQVTTPNKDKKDNKVKKVKKYIPADFQLDEKLKAFALEKDIASEKVNELFENFKDYHIGKGTKRVDWNRAWYTWVRNAREYSQWAMKKNKEGGFDPNWRDKISKTQ